MTAAPSPDDLLADYGLSVSRIASHSGGFESDCWVADDTWFIKVWRGGRQPERLELLIELRDLGLPVPAPLRTTRGELFSMCSERPFVVFEYVRGRTATGDDWPEVARALRLWAGGSAGCS
jgi:Ser/Thr protein kinase RdoA (MazF antagonist)